LPKINLNPNERNIKVARAHNQPTADLYQPNSEIQTARLTKTKCLNSNLSLLACPFKKEETSFRVAKLVNLQLFPSSATN
jgi:hypothetical protein